MKRAAWIDLAVMALILGALLLLFGSLSDHFLSARTFSTLRADFLCSVNTG